MYYDYVVSKPPLDEALAHYGVMGMKWGVRKDPERAYSKAREKSDSLRKKARISSQKKVEKASKKTKKTSAKLYKAIKKYNKRLNMPLPGVLSSQEKTDRYRIKKDKAEMKNAKANQKLSKALSNASKSSKKEERWNRAVVKSFEKEYSRIKNTAQTGEEKDIRISKLEKAYNKYWDKGNASDFSKEFKKK